MQSTTLSKNEAIKYYFLYQIMMGKKKVVPNKRMMATMYCFERKMDEKRLKSGVKNVDSGFNVLLPGSTEYEKSK